ncbi:MAG: hypothetical protein AB2788_19000, partial [Candidatus Thiodiazotropha endolucinida]
PYSRKCAPYICEVQMNGSTGEWFRLIVGFKQEYLLSSTLFNIFYTEFCNTLKDHEEKVSTGGKAITKVQFADD